MDGPAPGSYDVEKSIKKTQWVTKISAQQKASNHCFVDVISKRNRFVPGVGSYT